MNDLDLASLSPEEKRALLVKLLQRKAGATTAPTSPRQERASFFDQFALSAVDLDAQAMLDASIRRAAPPVEPRAEPARIFLTGATGFLGACLLHDLLRQTRADIYCLVRCSNSEEGRQRLASSLMSYALSGGDQRSRIIPIVGDLSRPLLGLSAQEFDTLADEVETIYHSGADVNWLSSYTQLKPTNVLGTQEVLRLACHRRVKPVHFVSSFSVFPLVGFPQGTVILEQDSLDHGGVLYGGYIQSKWVAEKLVTVAGSRGLPVCIYRPGLIVGHSQTGAWNTNDFMSRLIKSWIELGSAPDMGGAVDMTPVDYVSSAIVHLSRMQHAPGNVFHLLNPQRIYLQELVSWINSLGYPVAYIPYERWRSALINVSGRSREKAMYSLLPVFSSWLTAEMTAGVENSATSDHHPTVDRIGSAIAANYGTLSVKFDDQNTVNGLAGTSIVCPTVDAELLARYFSYFMRIGFLDPCAESGRARA